MEDLILDDPEQDVADELSAAVYATNARDLGQIMEKFRRLDGSSKEKVFSSVVSSASFSQRQRRDYIVGTVLNGQRFAGDDPRPAVLQLAMSAISQTGDLDVGGFGQQASDIDVDQLASNTELLNQLRFYAQTERRLVEFQSAVQLEYNVKPIFNLVNSYGDDELTSLITSIKAYVAQIKKLDIMGAVTDAPLPRDLTALLKKTGLNLFFIETISSGYRLEKLTIILNVAVAIQKNRLLATPMSDADLMAAIGQLLYYADVRIDFEK